MTILTCPFCGESPVLIYRKAFREYFVACQKRGCEAFCGRLWGSIKSEHEHLICITSEQAVERWNKSVDRCAVKLNLKEI